jgi:hypothetical protein
MDQHRRGITVCLLAVLLIGLSRPCQAAEPHKRSKKLWLVSVAMVVAANALDVASARGRYEGNPLLRAPDGRFTVGRGALLKSAGFGTALVVEAFVLRENPRMANSAAVANFVTAAAVTAVAVRNWGISRAEPPPPYLSGP